MPRHARELPIVRGTVTDETGAMARYLTAGREPTGEGAGGPGERRCGGTDRPFGSDSAVVLDARGTILFAAPAVEDMFGYPPEAIVSRRSSEFIHPDDMDKTRAVFARVVNNGGAAMTELRVRAADGTWRWVEEFLSNLLGTPVGGVVCNLIDKSERGSDGAVVGAGPSRQLSAEDSLVVQGLATALETSGLYLEYQPVVALGSGRVVGYEALIRWTHSELGELPPSYFVPLAEQNGLSRRLNRWVTERALEEFGEARRRGSVPAAAYVAINLSAQQLCTSGLSEELAAGILRSGIPPRQLVFEVTETAVMDDPKQASQLLGSMRRLGCRVALDDFGTGHSSLAMLRRLPVDILKIDRVFTDDMIDDPDARSIVMYILNMANALGLSVVAEGVETAGQASTLASLGCGSAQGWLWSRAVPMEGMRSTPRRFPLACVPAPSAKKSAPFDVDCETVCEYVSELLAQGASLATIASALNSNGYRTPADRRWTPASVARVIATLTSRGPAAD
jgi:PAS domain S-box-containing protein